MQPKYIFISLLAGYLAGSIPFGLLFARMMSGVDPRWGGSGNIGATNVARVAGIPAGIMTLVFDMAKGMIPVLAVGHWLGFWGGVLAGLGAFFGHIWPIYLKFKGGKGVATALGVIMAWSPVAFLGSVLVFVIAVWIKGYVSLGSMLGCASAPVWMAFWGDPLALVGAVTILASVVVWRHRSNILRLQEGTEPTLRHSLG